MRISDWSSDVCSSDLDAGAREADFAARRRGDKGELTGFARDGGNRQPVEPDDRLSAVGTTSSTLRFFARPAGLSPPAAFSLGAIGAASPWPDRSEEHTSELQSLMRNSYAAFCLRKKI